MSFIERGNRVAQFIADTVMFLGALLYIASIIFPLVGCHGVCTGTDGDAWMPAFLFSIAMCSTCCQINSKNIF